MAKSAAPSGEDYEQVPYPGDAFEVTHPDRLATIGTLFGMRPAPVEKCRVLELGCTDGGNLIPMAYGLPESSFTGIDLSPSAIERAQATATALHLGNVEFMALDILDLPADSGEFDFIIAHGVYSWVPEPVRDRILQICRNHLAAHGVAFVSYNAYPGCHFSDLARQMMLFHLRDTHDLNDKARKASEVLKLVVDARGESDLYRLILDTELDLVTRSSNASLFHDDLGKINEPVYFHQFAAHAARNDLQFLGEAEIEMMNQRLPRQVAEKLREFAGDIIAREQYIDFIKCRRFRQTLLCRADVPLRRTIDPGLVTRFHLASPCMPRSSHPRLDLRSVEEFEGPGARRFATDLPLAKAAFLHLGKRWPQAIAFSDLAAAAQMQLSETAEAAADGSSLEALANILMSVHAAGLVELHSHAPSLSVQAGEHPRTSPIARLQIQQRPVVANLRHCTVEVADDISADLLGLADGTRDRTELLAALRAARASRDNSSSPEPQNLTPEFLEECLSTFGRLALLVE